MRVAPLMIALILCAAGVCRAGDPPKPEIKSTSVLGVQAGKTTSVILYGEGLAPKSAAVKPPLSVKLVNSGATDAATKAKGSRQVTLEVTVPASCPRDNFEVTLAQPDNTLAKTSVSVVESTAVELAIKKPASTFESAMPLPGPSAAITGQLDGDSADLVRFDGKAGEIWDISLLAGRAGSLADPVLRIRDGRHITLALSAGDKKRDRHLTFHVPADGPYFVEITEAEAKGGAGYTYRLSVVRRPSSL